jgi:hypothetical protein
MTLKLPNGVYTYVGFVPMHRRQARRLSPYDRLARIHQHGHRAMGARGAKHWLVFVR